MKISIIIPCLNEEFFLPNLLIDLDNQTLKPHEVLVIDAGSKDRTLELITDKYNFLKVFHTKPNIGAQRTFGGIQADGELLFFLDSDVRLKNDFIKNSVDEFKLKKLDIACPTYIPYTIDDYGKITDTTFFILNVYRFLDIIFDIFQKILPSGAGSGILVTKELFIKCNGFCDHLKFDDIAFIRKASRLGKFGKLKKDLMVSDRRFRKYGPVKILLSYLVLSLFFIFNAFKAAEVIEYNFAEYNKN